MHHRQAAMSELLHVTTTKAVVSSERIAVVTLFSYNVCFETQ